MGFAGIDDNDGKDGARLLLPSSPKLMLLCWLMDDLRWLHVGLSLLCNIKLLERIISPDAPQHLSGSSSSGAGAGADAGAGAGSMSSHLVESIHCMTGGIWSMPK
jgi:hypothetical protein